MPVTALICKDFSVDSLIYPRSSIAFGYSLFVAGFSSLIEAPFLLELVDMELIVVMMVVVVICAVFQPLRGKYTQTLKICNSITFSAQNDIYDLVSSLSLVYSLWVDNHSWY